MNYTDMKRHRLESMFDAYRANRHGDTQEWQQTTFALLLREAGEEGMKDLMSQIAHTAYCAAIEEEAT